MGGDDGVHLPTHGGMTGAPSYAWGMDVCDTFLSGGSGLMTAAAEWWGKSPTSWGGGGRATWKLGSAAMIAGGGGE